MTKGESRLFYDVSPDHTHVAVVGLGQRKEDIPEGQTTMEDINVTAQNIRVAAATGAKLLQSAKVKNILMDDFNNAEGIIYVRVSV